MMTSRTHIENKRRQSWSMGAGVCGLGLSLSPTNYFGGRLGLESTIVDTPIIRQ